MTAKQTTERKRNLTALDLVIVEIMRAMPKDERAEILKELNK